MINLLLYISKVTVWNNPNAAVQQKYSSQLIHTQSDLPCSNPSGLKLCEILLMLVCTSKPFFTSAARNSGAEIGQISWSNLIVLSDLKFITLVGIFQYLHQVRPTSTQFCRVNLRCSLCCPLPASLQVLSYVEIPTDRLIADVNVYSLQINLL